MAGKVLRTVSTFKKVREKKKKKLTPVANDFVCGKGFLYCLLFPFTNIHTIIIYRATG